jgi:hypothetical protein
VGNLARFSTLLLNDAVRVSDREIRELEGFARRGGRVILAGRFAIEDELWQARTGGTALGLKLPGGWESGVHHFGRGEVLYCPLALGAMTQEALDRLLEVAQLRSLVEGPRRRGLRLNAYADAGRIAVHMINYRVPATGEPTIQRSVVLRVPLPGDWAGAPLAATWHEPGAASHALNVRVSGGEALVTVPRLRIYGVVELTLR